MKIKSTEFERLFTETYNAIFYYALYLCKDEDMAEDVVQDAYCKAYMNIHQLRDIKKFKAWVQKIVKNRVLQIYIEKAKFETIEIDDAYANPKFAPFMVNENYLPEDLLLRKETKRYIFHLINELDDDYRNVLILFYYYSYSYEDIGDLLNLNIGTVKSRIHRAKKVIYKKLIDKYYNDEKEMIHSNKENDVLAK
ncbi:MAG: RNA polymerase sigma factor [Clostridia bacterium]